eukprot:7201977-Prymnesium_polylepis.1
MAAHLLVLRTDAELLIWQCLPNMAVSSQYGNTVLIWQPCPNLACPNLAALSECGSAHLLVLRTHAELHLLDE